MFLLDAPAQWRERHMGMPPAARTLILGAPGVRGMD
jgi:hypothetical protein